ncbi:MAG: type II toxin-antitoxin system VapC family toxin [Nitrospirae bacterium]|nr:type II toxin-antitoxin system VapC family toxin [Nitrospirota bacterium]
MFLHEIEAGSKVFIDTNVFVYHFSNGSKFNKSCTDFLYRVEMSQIHGVTSAGIIMEASHRLMMVEASSVLAIEIRNLPKYLKQHPDIVKQLTKHLTVPNKIAGLNIEIVRITQKVIEASQFNKTKYGFLSNDALTLKIMEDIGIASIASNDSDFKRVDWLKLYLPASSD